MRRTRTKYTKEFKKDAVNLILRSERSIRKISDELGVEYNLLCRWKREFDTHEEKAFPGQGNPVEVELAKLKRELLDIKEERDILKKAVAIFSKEAK
jgi:transposase